ncbi:MAG: T9SS type A sorting domain-containing protein, partial [Bacteroidota bacterium]
FGSKVGEFAVTEPARTKYTNANKAVTHTSGGTGISGSSNTWSMDWTAPNPAPSVVKFNAAFNAANGNGMTSGDVIYTSLASYNLFIPPNPQLTGVEPNNQQQGYEGELNITGDETSWTVGVSSVMFVFHDDNNISFSASEISVVGDDMLTIIVTIPEDIEIGSYDVHVDELILENGFMVDIYDDIHDNYLTDAVSIYPNPATDNVNIQAPIGSQINIVDISGRTMAQYIVGNSSDLNINISSYNSGLYFIQVAHEGNSFSKKLLVK